MSGIFADENLDSALYKLVKLLVSIKITVHKGESKYHHILKD